MQISLRREDLLKPLSQAAGVVERRQTLPILSNLLFDAQQEKLTITGTDLEVEVVAACPASFDQGGRFTLPARKLLDICRALPEQSVLEIRPQDGKTVIKSGKSRFTLATLPETDFPALEVSKWHTALSVPQRSLKGLIERAQFCMAQQDVRYYLNGLLLELKDGKIRAVATDGHRLALSEMDHAGSTDGEKQVIIPRKAVHEIVRFLQDTDDPTELQISTNHIRFSLGDVVLTAKLIDGRFPDYTKVVPNAQSLHISLDREQFHHSLSRVAILTNEKYRGVRLGLAPGQMEIVAHNPEQEEAQEELSVDFQGEGMEIGFNVNYIIDAVNALPGDTVVLGMNDPNSSCTLTAPGDKHTQYVIMPMRL